MNTPSQTHFLLLKKFVSKTLTYIWLAYVLIPYSLDETIDICIDSLCNDNANTPKIPKDVFCDFIFSNKFYKQIYGVAMGSS